MAATVTLYGVPHSLYTGKTRSYLRKQSIAYVERPPTDPAFRERIVPAIGRGILPVVELPDGTIVQDTVDILDHFEAAGVPLSARPPGPCQRVLAHVAELYAVVGLTRHAMHYRWSYLDEQRAFLTDAFAAGSGPDAAEKVMARMNGYLPMLGVTPETIPAIEDSYHRLLDLLEAHFAEHPYLFGGRPSIGDYGLLGPLFAHLGRDPVPCGIMKRRAPKVFRWVERMNAPDADMPEYGAMRADWLPDDDIPSTLIPLFRHMAEELFPELTDKIAALTDILAGLNPVEGQPVTDKPHRRIVGTVATSFRGAEYESGIQPYMLYLWQRMTDARDAAEPAERERVATCLAETGLGALLDTRRPIRVERRGHIELWGNRPE